MGYAAKPQRELVLFYPQEAFSSPQLLKASRPTLPSLCHLGKAGAWESGLLSFIPGSVGFASNAQSHSPTPATISLGP